MGRTAETVLYLLLLSPIAGFLLWRRVIAWWLAAKTTPADELIRIRVHLEGLQGMTGPSKDVMVIERDGHTSPMRGTPAQRNYLVTMTRPDGRVEQRRVSVEVALLGGGTMTVSERF